MYPPYSDIFQIVFTSASEEAAREGATLWHRRLMELLPEEDRVNVFDPQQAYMSRVRDTYRYSLIIKCPRGSRQRYAGMINILQEEETLRARKKKADFIAVVDINPYSFT